MCPVHQGSQPCPPPWSWRGWSCVFGPVLECSPLMSAPEKHTHINIYAFTVVIFPSQLVIYKYIIKSNTNADAFYILVFHLWVGFVPLAHLDERCCGPEAHLCHRLPLPSARQSVETWAGAGERAKRGGSGGDGGLRHAVAIHLLHHSKGSSSCQRVHNLETNG